MEGDWQLRIQVPFNILYRPSTYARYSNMEDSNCYIKRYFKGRCVSIWLWSPGNPSGPSPSTIKISYGHSLSHNSSSGSPSFVVASSPGVSTSIDSSAAPSAPTFTLLNFWRRRTLKGLQMLYIYSKYPRPFAS